MLSRISSRVEKIIEVAACDNITEKVRVQCDKKQGLYCHQRKSKSYQLFLSTMTTTTIRQDLQSATITCNDTLEAKLCPAGYYCASNYVKSICPVGNFCPVGQISPIECQYGVISCPMQGLSEYMPGVLFVCLFLTLTAIIAGYRYFALFSLNREDNEWNQLSQKYKKNPTGTLNMFALEHDQYVLHRLSAADTTLYTGYIDDTPTPANVSESSNLLSYAFISDQTKSSQDLSGQLATSIVDYDAPGYSALPESKLASRSKELIAMHKLNSYFKFTSIRKPISVQFECLTLYLKSNNFKILDNVSAELRPSEITAIMGPSGSGES